METRSAYHLYGITGFFFSRNEHRSRSELYHLQNTGKFERKPCTVNPYKWYKNFRSFRHKQDNTAKGITFFPKNFLRNEPFHLNSCRNFRVFHTNGKRSRLLINTDMFLGAS